MKAAVRAMVGCAWLLPILLSQAAETGATNIVPGHSMMTMGGMVAPSKKQSPIFSGSHLVQPPEQKSEWVVQSSDIPANYVTATKMLFEQGLADPRGCDYREFEVGTGDVWSGDGGVVKTHGWVLPGRAEPQFGICWNGLEYPLVSVGTNADLDADAELMISNGFTSWQMALPERRAIAPETFQGFRGCLLLRLGKVELAKRFWLAAWHRGFEYRNTLLSGGRSQSRGTNNTASPTETQLPDADQYLTWASDWAWSLFDRLIGAHQRGDENLAVLDARQLSAAQPLIEAECAKRGFKRQPYWDSRRSKEQQSYLTFLDQLPQIRADLERRDKEGSRTPAIARGLTNITDQAERVKLLIRDLDVVGALQWSQPGGVNPAEDPTVAALIAEGDAAVEPLLDCVENDQRLTRSVSFGRDFQRGRSVLTVKNAASVALQSLLQAGFSNPAEMRAYWNKYKHLKLEDRWYAILSDEGARARWREAAANITQPTNIARFPGGFRMEYPVPTNTPVKMRGESLRAKRDPSVSELLARHALEVPTNDVGAYDVAGCCQMAEYLARWDPPAALPVAKTLSKRVSDTMRYSSQPLGTHLTKLCLARAAAGDPLAFEDYVDWIVTTTPGQFDRSSLDCLDPFRRFPTNDVLQKAAEKLFANPTAAWGNLPWTNTFGGTVIDAQLVPIPAYRELLRRELNKTNDCGTVTKERPDYLRYENRLLNQNGSFTLPLPATSANAVTTNAPIRWNDWIALSLAKEKIIEPFDPFAPIQDRNDAIQMAIFALK